MNHWEEEFLQAIGVVFDEDECEWKTKAGVFYESIMELIDGENLYAEFYPYLLHFCKVSEIDPDELIKEVNS